MSSASKSRNVLIELRSPHTNPLYQIAFEAVVAVALLKWPVRLCLHQECTINIPKDSLLSLQNWIEDKEIFGIQEIALLDYQDPDSNIPIDSVISIEQYNLWQDWSNLTLYY